MHIRVSASHEMGVLRGLRLREYRILQQRRQGSGFVCPTSECQIDVVSEIAQVRSE